MLVDRSRLVSPGALLGTDDQETAELVAMHQRAREFLTSHPWCAAIGEELAGGGVGGVVSVSLFRTTLASGDEEWLWVVEGDLPSAYLVTDAARTPAEALERYAELMEDWIETVRAGAGFEDVFPVRAPRDEEHASMLESRIRFLRREIVPRMVEAGPGGR
jgi:hypothetical protein